MEIKIVHRKSDNEFAKTYLYEGENITHFFEEFKSKKEFIEKYNVHTHKLFGGVVGVPDEIWKEDSHECSGGFQIIFYNVSDGDECKFIIVMNSRIYITCKGQTVDTIIV
jgi:hypothetical protein